MHLVWKKVLTSYLPLPDIFISRILFNILNGWRENQCHWQLLSFGWSQLSFHFYPFLWGSILLVREVNLQGICYFKCHLHDAFSNRHFYCCSLLSDEEQHSSKVTLLPQHLLPSINKTQDAQAISSSFQVGTTLFLEIHASVFKGLYFAISAQNCAWRWNAFKFKHAWGATMSSGF